MTSLNKDTHKQIIFKNVIDYREVLYHYFFNTFDNDLEKYETHDFCRKHLNMNIKEYLYRYCRPSQLLWGMIKKRMATMSQWEVCYSYEGDGDEWFDENFEEWFREMEWCPRAERRGESCDCWGQPHHYGCIVPDGYYCFQGRDKDMASRIQNHWLSWYKLMKKRTKALVYIQRKRKGLDKEEASEIIGNWIFEKIFDTKYKIGRRFFEFRLKKDGLDYE